MTETGRQTRARRPSPTPAAGQQPPAPPWRRWGARIPGLGALTARRGSGRGRLKRWLGSQRAVALILLLAACMVRTFDPAPVETLRTVVFDFYQNLKPRRADQFPVVIVDIDEDSLSALGHWPWPRTVLADMVERLSGLGAAAIGFDIVFAEPDRLSPRRLAEAIEGLDETTARALGRLPGNDEVFAKALRGSRVVLGQSVQARAEQDAARGPPLKTAVAEIGGDPRPHLGLKYAGLVRNLPLLEQASAGRGLMTFGLERDAIVRRVPAVFQVGQDLFPALAIELLRVATGQSAYAIKSNRDGITAIVVAGVRIPTDARGRVWIHFGPHARQRYLSAKDVLDGAAAPGRVAGKLVLVGTSASGLLDIRATPLGSAMPGVEIHAQLLENILAGTYLLRPAQALGMELAITLLAGLLMIALLPRLGARWTLLLFAIVLAAAALGSWYLYVERRMLIDVAYAALVTLLIYSFLTYASYSRAEAQRREVRTAFSRYLAPALVERLASDPSQLTLGGESRFMTLLFCDVEDFTTISEQHDAQSLTRLVNRFLTPMTEAILQWDGTVDKYMGDSVMAFWNAPLDDEDHARHACLAALDMQTRIEGLNVELKAEAKSQGGEHVPIRIGVGVNSGVCMVGNMGSAQRFDYSVLGDTVNVASRLEGQTRTYRVGIVVGESVHEQVPELAVIELDLIRVLGKTVPERIYAVLGDEAVAAGEAFSALKSTHENMLAAYRARDWPGARHALARCGALGAGFELGGLYDMFEERIKAFEKRPPPRDWGGVHVATTK